MSKFIKTVSPYFSLSILKEYERYVFTLGLIMVLFLVWSGFIAFQDTVFSLNGLIKIHRSFLVWFVDVIVLSLPLLIVGVLNYNKIRTQELITQIKVLRKKLKII